MISAARFLLAIGAVALVAACVQLSPPTRYYALSSLPPTTQEAKPLVVGVGPVAMADYLDRPQIVTRSTAMELQLHEFELWVEALETIFPRTLGENLSSLLGTDRVVLMPAPREVRLDYQIEVDVLRFDAMRPGEVMLDAGWRIYGRDGEQLIRDSRSRITKPVVEPAADDTGPAQREAEMPAIVAAMSEATIELSRQIATAIASARR
jgi:hypothetical protein